MSTRSPPVLPAESICFPKWAPRFNTESVTNVWSNPSLFFSMIIRHRNSSLQEREIFEYFKHSDLTHLLCMHKGERGTFRMVAHFPSIFSSCSTFNQGKRHAASLSQEKIYYNSEGWTSASRLLSCHLTKWVSGHVLWDFPGELSTQDLTKRYHNLQGECDSNFT